MIITKEIVTENYRDEDVASYVQRGHVEWFSVLMERYEAKLSRYARRFFFHGDEIKDAVQEVFIKAYVNIRSFDTDRRFSPWLYRIAHNEFVNEVRRKQKEKNNISIFEIDTLFPHLIATSETAEKAVMRAEVKQQVNTSLGALNEKYREPLILYYLKDMDYRGIAKTLRIPVSTVGVRLQRGKRMLKEREEASCSSRHVDRHGVDDKTNKGPNQEHYNI